MGVLHIYTGDGKGKTSASMGMVMRSLGYGKKVLVCQFMKGAWNSGEKQFLLNHPEVTYIHGKTGFSWIDTDREEQREDVFTILQGLKEAIAQEDYHLVVLDEINVVLDLGYITPEEIAEILAYRESHDVHMICSGRGVPEELHQHADLITEMKEIKHPFQAGIPAQEGVDY